MEEEEKRGRRVHAEERGIGQKRQEREGRRKGEKGKGGEGEELGGCLTGLWSLEVTFSQLA